MNLSDRKELATPKPDVWLNVRTVAERLDCSDKIIRTLIKEGHLPAKRFRGRTLKILEADLDKFTNKQMRPSAEDCEIMHRTPPIRRKP